MTQDAAPRNPLRTYQFRVGFSDPLIASAASSEGGGEASAAGGDYVAGVQRISGLNLSIGVNETWSGGNSLHRYANPDKVSWDPITLEQGLALTRDLETWARVALEFIRTGSRPDVPLKRNLFIDVWDPYTLTADNGAGGGASSGDCLRRYEVFNAWISRYQALPQMDAMVSEVALLTVELVHEGWRIANPNELPSGFRRVGSTDTEEG